MTKPKSGVSKPTSAVGNFILRHSRSEEMMGLCVLIRMGKVYRASGTRFRVPSGGVTRAVEVTKMVRELLKRQLVEVNADEFIVLTEEGLRLSRAAYRVLNGKWIFPQDDFERVARERGKGRAQT